MRVPLEWLREYCDPPLDVAGIEERLTMTGTKVEAVHHHGVGAPERFVVGRVLRAEPHPDAERLRVCEVDLGAARPEGPATIVCGAPNVAAGQLVAVARPGAVMPDGTTLREVKLRGVRSEGMILAEDELAIGLAHDGILTLEGLAPAGKSREGEPLEELLPIATEVIELEVTPNRPDCLGVFGVARELHAATGAPLAREPWLEDPGSEGPVDGVVVEVRCPDLCPRFTARVLTEVRVGPSPPWLKARLMAAGTRPINNVVDVTNYVMLLTAQPLHAFDLDRVAGGRLVVRRAGRGELVRTLDGQERALDEEMALIADDEGPTSIAGVMGGARSEVSDDTTRVLLEVASWDGPGIHGTSSALGLRSEASARFEKGLPPESCDYAQAVACRLLVELCGAQLAPGTIDVRAPARPVRAIALRTGRVERILGMPVARERQVEILRSLDFDVREERSRRGERPGAQGAAGKDTEMLLVTPPPLRRADVSREADLIEEIARIAGLEHLPVTLPRRRGAYGVLSREQRMRRRVTDVLVGRGLYEAIGWTFSAPERLGELRVRAGDPRRDAVRLRDPLSHEQSELRTMLLGSLLEVAARNVARGASDLALFEQGAVFRADAKEGVQERRALGVLLAGRVAPATWRSPRPRGADFFALKAHLEALGGALGVTLACRRAEGDAHPFLHPGRAAEVVLEDDRSAMHRARTRARAVHPQTEHPNPSPPARASGTVSPGTVSPGVGSPGAGSPLGWMGELHPSLVSELLGGGLQRAAAFEVDLDALVRAAAARPVREYREIPVLPALLRDLAVIVPDELSAAAVLEAVRESGGQALEGARVFDVYEGEQVGEGRRSLAVALSFRAPGRTLSDADVEPALEAIVARMHELGGELRA
jgi:phenylalanyl-tRNA synthetase beta chain